jgi:transposase InsO family protein
MDERLRFISAVTSGEASMAAMCRQFGISRKTGYKWQARYRTESVTGLADRRRAPHSRPHAVAPPVRAAVLALREQHPTWGPKKLVARLRAAQPAVRWPAPSTVGDLLSHAGLVVPRQRRRHALPRTQPLAHATGPNVVWCADFKGDFALGDGTRCYPLTITDAASRYLLRCQALARGETGTARVQPLFEATFREFGLPDRIRTDNGPPFASVGVGGLTPVAVSWVKLGILPERIDPGKPAQNGRHERMHRTLGAEACAPPAASLREQQGLLDRFRQEYNTDRPHEALGQVPPATVYVPATRPFPDHVPELTYPAADAVRWVRPNGALKWHGREVYVSQTLAGEPVGLTQVGDGRWQLAFGLLVLGVVDEPTGKLVVGGGGVGRPRPRPPGAAGGRPGGGRRP